MRVRLQGIESTEKAQFAVEKISHSYTDVPEWANSCVAWLYMNKLTNGVCATAFGANGQCMVKMCCTFVLLALGYSCINILELNLALANTVMWAPAYTAFPPKSPY